MKRYIQIDALRGFLLTLMMIDHLPGFVRAYSYQMFGFVSAAEGFVFISGYVAGLVYSRLFINNDIHVLTKRVQKRAVVIYLYHFIMYSGILLLCVLIPSLKSTGFKSLSPLFFSNPLQSFLLGSALLYQPVYLNILPMYVIFLFLLPVFLHMFYKRKEKTVFFISLAFWFFAQAHLLFRSSLAIHNIIPINLGNFDIMGWQFIFMIGSYLGFRKFQSEQLLQPAKKRVFQKRFFFLLFSFIYIFFLLLRYGLISSHITPELFRHLFDVHSLGVLRLVNFFTLAYLISLTFPFFEKKKITKFLALLGQHSLQVYSFHIIILYAIFLFLKNWQIFPIYVQLLLYFSGIALLFFSAWLHCCKQRRKITFHSLVLF